MREKPILFSTPMVKAILEGRKTMTRRVVKPQPAHMKYWFLTYFDCDKNGNPMVVCPDNTDNSGIKAWADKVKVPYQPGIKLLSSPTQAGWYDVKWEPGDNWERIWVFEGGETWGRGPNDDPEAIDLDVADPNLTEWKTPGDLLWVRETWSFITCAECIGSEIHSDFNSGGCCIPISGKGCLMGECGCFIYRANYGTTEDDSFPPSMFKWRPSIHMPKAAARIWLEATDVRVERLQEITEEDAKAEGFEDSWDLTNNRLFCTAKENFEGLWNTLNLKRGYGWDVNPWVFVIEFKRVNHE